MTPPPDPATHEPFLRAFEALRRTDYDQLERLLRQHPDLLRARGTNGNSLLNLAVSIAGSSCGALPAPARRMLTLLLGSNLDGERGTGADPVVDVDLANDHGWTPLHQAAYANRCDLATILLDAGASIEREARGAGGTPLAVALFWGHRDVAELLAARGVTPSNLRVAAGLGRADLLARQFAADGTLEATAGNGRGFYRPHSGFPEWQPTGDPQEILDEALVWAAKSDRLDALAFLVERGARIDADPYRGTALLWAASCGREAAAGWLLEHGADVNQRATFGGPEHGEGVTALHLAAQNGNLAMTRLLCERGADPTLEDRIYSSSPLGWAEHFGRASVLEYLRSRREAGRDDNDESDDRGRPS